MTEHSGHRPNVYAALEKPGRSGMPYVVEPRRGDFHIAGEPVERVADRAGVPRSAERVGKHEIADLVLRPLSQALRVLSCTMRTKR